MAFVKLSVNIVVTRDLTNGKQQTTFLKAVLSAPKPLITTLNDKLILSYKRQTMLTARETIPIHTYNR